MYHHIVFILVVSHPAIYFIATYKPYRNALSCPA